MAGSDDWELDRLRSLDPALRDAPPAPGSVRYDAILERAMSQQTIEKVQQRTQIRPAVRRRRRWLGWGAVTGVAAAAAAVAVTVAVVGGPAESASAAVLQAADRTGTVTSLRYEMWIDSPAGFATTGEAAGDRVREVRRGEGVTSTVTVIGDQVYTTRDGKTTREPVADGYRRAPFGPTAGKVVRAVASDADVEKIGTDEVRGVEATHYRLTLPERTSAAQPAPKLAELAPEELEWFELGHVADAGTLTLDLWVADDLVRRLTTQVTGQSLNSYEFYDFNAPITIEPPAGS